MSFELDGFKKLVRSGVTVEAAMIRSVAVTLEVGGVTETVQVAADAALLNMTSSTTARSLSSVELESVPTSTGSFTHLLSSEAGVSADLPPVLINGTGKHFAVGERHAHDEHEPVLQRHRCHEPDDQRRLDERQHLSGV